MRSELIRAFARTLVAVIVLAAGCTGGDGRADADFHGFMVLGDRAVKFGLTPGDTLVEQPASRIPAALRREAEHLVRRAEYRVGCTRYWTRGPATVVLVARYCYGKSLDDQIVGLFDRPRSDAADILLFREEGERFVRDPRSFGGWTTACPLQRDKRGRPSSPC